MSARLCTVVHGPYPIDPRVAREVRVARQMGFGVDVVALRRPGEPLREVVEGARVFRVPIQHRRGANLVRIVLEYVGFTSLASLRVAVLAFRNRYAVVQINTPPDFLIVSALVPKALGARVVLDVHDLSSDMFDMRYHGRAGSRLAERVLRLVERIAVRVSDVVITVHEPYRRELIAHGAPPEKVEVVMNAVDDAVVPTKRDEKSEEHFRVVYHGTITPPYGVHLLVDAIAELACDIPNARLELYGEGDALPSIIERAEELGVADKVSSSGRYLPQREVLEAISSADVGVVPNVANRLNRFALSSKLFEYVAAEVPVACADLPTIRAHFSTDELLFFPNGDATALAAALRQIAREPNAAAARARAALERYRAEYRWPIFAERYARVLMNGVPDS